MQVIDGGMLWGLKATHGLPLDISLMRCAQDGMVPAWDTLFEAAKKDGADIAKLARELCFYVKEAYEPDYAKVVCERLPLLAARY